MGFFVAGTTAALADDPQAVDQSAVARTVYQVVMNQDDGQATLVEYTQASQADCAGCADPSEYQLDRNARFMARANRLWQDQGSVGLSLQRGATSFGVFGDVREINIVENEEQRLLPRGITNNLNVVPDAVAPVTDQVVTDNAGGQQKGGNQPTNGGSISNDRVVGRAISADAVAISAPIQSAPVQSAPIQASPGLSAAPTANVRGFSGGISGGAVTANQVRSISNADLAYKEYVGGIFMSQSF